MNVGRYPSCSRGGGGNITQGDASDQCSVWRDAESLVPRVGGYSHFFLHT